jgi:hypothetical protein
MLLRSGVCRCLRPGRRSKDWLQATSALPLDLAPLGAGKETVGDASGREELPLLVLESVRELFKTARKWPGGPRLLGPARYGWIENKKGSLQTRRNLASHGISRQE